MASGPARFAARCPSRLPGRVVRLAGLFGAVAAIQTVPAQELTGERLTRSELVKADLSRLSDLQRGYFEKNKTYTVDSRALNFAPTSGAQISMSYASVRSWAANATHPVIAPFVCFIIVSSPAANTPAEKPFCTDSRRGTAASTLTQASPAAAPSTPASAGVSKAAADSKVAAKAAAVPSPGTAVQQVAAARQDVPRKQAVTPPQQAAPTPAPQKAQQRRPLVRRVPIRPAPVLTVPTPLLPAQGEVGAAARLQTRGASPVAGGPGPVEAVTTAQFTDRLVQIATGALDALNAKLPELTRDEYESSEEFEGRRAQAMAQFARREVEYFAVNSRTFVVQLQAKDAKYDADREVLEFSVDPVPLPTSRSFSTGGGSSQLTVTCYTRPVFWCAPDAGMTYEAGDLWRVPRARARELDVLRTPLTLQARFAVGSRDDLRGPALTLLGLELQAKGQPVARWEAPIAGAR